MNIQSPLLDQITVDGGIKIAVINHVIYMAVDVVIAPAAIHRTKIPILITIRPVALLCHQYTAL
jgi:pentose-5-phosphate-3-epimerase